MCFKHPRLRDQVTEMGAPITRELVELRLVKNPILQNFNFLHELPVALGLRPKKSRPLQLLMRLNLSPPLDRA